MFSSPLIFHLKFRKSRLCLNSSNTYLMNIFNNEYHIVDKINELISLEVGSLKVTKLI